MSADGQSEPGATMNGAPRGNAEQGDSPYHDYGPTLFQQIQASASAVSNAVVGRSRVRTVPRGRASVQNEKEEKDEGAEERALGRPLTPTRRVAPGDGTSGGSTPNKRRLAPDPVSGVPAALLVAEVFSRAG